MPRSRSLNVTSKADLSASLGLFLAVCAVAKAARQCYSLHRPGPSITGFILPSDTDLKLYERALEWVAFRCSHTDDYGNRDTVIIDVPDDQKKRRQEQQFDEIIHDHGPATQSAGGAVFRLESLMERTRQQFMDRICLGLAGLAAEELVFGQRGAGGGGEPGSELHRVTAHAISVEATYGLGPELAYLSSQSEEELFAAQRYNPELRKRVNKTLDDEYQRATEILTARREQLDPLANLLLERRTLSTDEVKSIVEDQLSLGLELAIGEKSS